MHLDTFVACMDDASFRALMDACIVRLQDKKATGMTLLDSERDLAKFSRVKAIKSVKSRLKLGLLDAKNLVEREVPKEPETPAQIFRRDPSLSWACDSCNARVGQMCIESCPDNPDNP